MAALTQDRDTIRRDGLNVAHPVASGVKIFLGAIVALSATGYAQPGETAADLTVCGIAEGQVDNTNGADGDATVVVSREPHRVSNDGTVTRAHVGKDCYLVDDQTVAAADGGGTRSRAGKVLDLDADGVWLEFR